MEGLSQLKSMLDDNGIFLSFSGPISQNLMAELGQILKNQMKMAEADTATIVKVFSVLVEQSQNILHHSADIQPAITEKSDGMMQGGTIAVGFKEEKYFVLGGNKIRKEQEGILRKKLMQISKLNKDELKQLYHKQRKEGTGNEEGSAGLGLIDLARKASEPIQYDFIPIDGVFSFFSIRTLI